MSRVKFTGEVLHRSLAEAGECDYAIKVDDITMIFNIANERLSSLKEYVIKLAQRQLFYREFKALQNISLEVKKGDVYGIVGTNGSGKSTLLKIIAGVLEPTTGRVEVNGAISPLIELGAGFDAELTARENIYLNGSLLGYSREYIDEHVEQIVDFAELWDFMEMPLKNYSSGMVARIAFAIATVSVPDVLIVDETLSVGDMFFQEKCEARMNELINGHGTTVLFVSHSITQVERLCKQAIWIEHGLEQMTGDAKEVCEAYRKSHG
jgi:ABC-2 type transport system ATP-binding protein